MFLGLIKGDNWNKNEYKSCVFYHFSCTYPKKALTLRPQIYIAMRHIISILFLLCTLTVFSSQIDPILGQLDVAVNTRNLYVQRKIQDIEQLKRMYQVAGGQQQYDLAEQIYKAYNAFDTDSALLYSEVCMQLAHEMGNDTLFQRAQIYLAQCYSINCLFEEANNILIPMESQLLDANYNLYYRARTSGDIWMSNFQTLAEKSAQAYAHVIGYRDSIIFSESNLIWQKHERALILAPDNPRAALDLILPILDTLDVSNDFTRFIANSAGSFYTSLQMQDSALHYYAMSAISDIQHGIMEHASLREVALIMFANGDIERSYRYMSTCIDDAQHCKARLRTIEMAGDMPLILDTYHARIHNQRIRLVVFLIVISLLLIIAAMLALYAFRMSRQSKIESLKALDESHRAKEAMLQLQASNQSLEEANRIRSAYVTQYMTHCSQAIQQMDTYHTHLMHIAVSEPYKKLIEAIRSTDFIEENIRTFYQQFDETFLSLFPHFITDMNALLLPDKGFSLSLNGKHLSTELRIYALIRLGITESDDIARFLRLSTKTVYNYRAAVRNRARGNRDQLEQQVLLIGR